MRVIDNYERTTLHWAIKPFYNRYPSIKPKSALEDYQTQLMLLEQQNKKRLLMARGVQMKDQPKDQPTVEAIGRVMHLLLEGGVNIAAKDNFGHSALHLAAELGSETLVRLLLDWEADIAAKTQNGQTVLHTAAYNGYNTVVQLLLDRGADVAATDDFGFTALHIAAGTRCETLVRLLLSRGAEVRVIDNYERTTLHWAIKPFYNRYPSIKPKSALEDYQTQLMLLEQQNKKRLLMARGVQMKDQPKDQPTVEAIGRVMHLLLEGGVNIAAKDNFGHSALHLAAELGSETLVRLLLDWEADIAAKTQNGQTVLHTAAYNGYNTVVQLLLDRGADIAAKDNDGLTALQHATKNGRNDNPAAQLLRSVTQAKCS